MAHKKGLGSSKNGRDSNPKYLGVKIFDGQDVRAGQIIVRQRGTKFRPGPGTQIGRDDTIFAVREGTVEFRTSGERRIVSVVEPEPRPSSSTTRPAAGCRRRLPSVPRYVSPCSATAHRSTSRPAGAATAGSSSAARSRPEGRARRR